MTRRTLAEHAPLMRIAALNIAATTTRRPSHWLSGVLSLVCWIAAGLILLCSSEIAGPMVRGWLL